MVPEVEQEVPEVEQDEIFRPLFPDVVCAGDEQLNMRTNPNTQVT